MSYRQLHDFFQEFDAPVSRKPIREKVREITGKPLKVVKTTLDTRLCRGMYFSPQNLEQRLVQQLGCGVIALPREGNNYCWERFVETKEYMHSFDTEDEATDTGEEFDQLLKDFTSSVNFEQSPQMNSEIKAFWRALAILCPETVRQGLVAEREERCADLNDYAVALRLRIPEQVVPNLFLPHYPAFVDRVLAD